MANEINSVKEIITSTDNATRKYISENYSTTTQTDEKIASEVKSVKEVITDVDSATRTYINENYSTTIQTADMIENKVSSYDSRLGSVESKITQTADKIESKVSAGDVYSLIEQLPYYVKISADNIDLSGDVSVVGNFKTNQFGKKVEIRGTEIIFYGDYGYAGELSISDDNVIRIRGGTGTESMIRMNASQYVNYTNFSGTMLDSYLFGTWGATGFYTFGLVTKYVKVDQQIETFGDIIAHKSIKLGDYLYIQKVGNQVWIGDKYGGKFVIDTAEKKTFWA